MKWLKPLRSLWGRRVWSKILVLAAAVIILLLIASAYTMKRVYQQHLLPVSGDQTIRLVTIRDGSSVSDIADVLKAKDLIKSSWAFEWYVRSQKLNNGLLYGTYGFKQSDSIPRIVESLRTGNIATDVVTILPAKRLEEIRLDLIEDGFSPANVDKALNPANYSGHPALAAKPANASLEGYLFPESFHKTADTTAEDIVSKSLDEMDKRLTPELGAAFSKHGLDIHQAVTLASIVEEEISYKDKQREASDRAQVAQVFLSRRRLGMRLETDPTVRYAVGKQAFDSLTAADFESSSPYNTYQVIGLPPGPISNASESSLLAVAKPAKTDWLYFVSGCEKAGDDIRTYFSRTLNEHQSLSSKYLRQDCKQ